MQASSLWQSSPKTTTKKTNHEKKTTHNTRCKPWEVYAKFIHRQTQSKFAPEERFIRARLHLNPEWFSLHPVCSTKLLCGLMTVSNMDHVRRSLSLSSAWLTVSQQNSKISSDIQEFCFVFCKNILPSFSHHTLVFHKGRTCFARRADAEKRCDAVDACGTLGAGRRGAVINVLRAVGPTPAVNTHADVAANQVGASPSILASVWLQAALVDVFGTVLPYRERRKKEVNSGDQTLN